MEATKMRSELYLLSGAAIGMAAAFVLIIAQPGEVGGSSTEMNSYSVELDQSVMMTAERQTAPAGTIIKNSPMTSLSDREVRVILPSPYEGVSPGGVR
jgi:hypothetical protein